MSEEQANFKVTDRRLFNPDGTLRESARQEEEKAAAPSTQEAAASSAAPTAAPPGAPAASQAAAEPASARAGASGQSQQVEMPEDDYGDEEMQDADDPASFINFLMSIASNAASALGMMEHPVTGQRGVDLALAKHWIDVLGMLQQKTRGNLSAQERQIMEGLLSDLRMQYVSLTGAPRPSGPRGFTGRDITGGK